MFECWWQYEGFEAWHLRGDLRKASRRWQHRLHDELWIWVNVAGEGVVWGNDHRIFLRPGLFGCFGGQDGEAWKWTRMPGEHEAEILVIPRAYVAKHFGNLASEKNTPFARWLRGDSGVAFVGKIDGDMQWMGDLLSRGWKSRKIPVRLRNSFSRWVHRILGVAAQPTGQKFKHAKSTRTNQSIISSGSGRSADR